MSKKYARVYYLSRESLSAGNGGMVRRDGKQQGSSGAGWADRIQVGSGHRDTERGPLDGIAPDIRHETPIRYEGRIAPTENGPGRHRPGGA